VKLESLQKQSESALFLHLVSCIQVFRQLGSTPGADGAGPAGAEDEATEEAGAGEVGCCGELGVEAGAEDAGGATHLVQTVMMEVLMMVETLWVTTA
jgi:hypothetical protein